MDTTSLSFYGEGGETLGEHGYSKDYRDARQRRNSLFETEGWRFEPVRARQSFQ
jgi:hypothetical protein